MTRRRELDISVECLRHESNVTAALSTAASRKHTAWHEAGLFVQRCIQSDSLISKQDLGSLVRLLQLCRQLLGAGQERRLPHTLQQAALQYKMLRLLREQHDWDTLVQEGLGLLTFLLEASSSADHSHPEGDAAERRSKGLQQVQALQQHAIAAVCCAMGKLPHAEAAFAKLCAASALSLQALSDPARLARQVLSARLQLKGQPSSWKEVQAFTRLCKSVDAASPGSSCLLLQALCGHAHSDALWHIVADCMGPEQARSCPCNLVEVAVRELFKRHASGTGGAASGLSKQSLMAC
jgi:hypothetical protein